MGCPVRLFSLSELKDVVIYQLSFKKPMWSFEVISF